MHVFYVPFREGCEVAAKLWRFNDSARIARRASIGQSFSYRTTIAGGTTPDFELRVCEYAWDRAGGTPALLVRFETTSEVTGCGEIGLDRAYLL